MWRALVVVHVCDTLHNGTQRVESGNWNIYNIWAKNFPLNQDNALNVHCRFCAAHFFLYDFVLVSQHRIILASVLIFPLHHVPLRESVVILNGKLKAKHGKANGGKGSVQQMTLHT